MLDLNFVNNDSQVLVDNVAIRAVASVSNCYAAKHYPPARSPVGEEPEFPGETVMLTDQFTPAGTTTMVARNGLKQFCNPAVIQLGGGIIPDEEVPAGTLHYTCYRIKDEKRFESRTVTFVTETFPDVDQTARIFFEAELCVPASKTFPPAPPDEQPAPPIGPGFKCYAISSRPGDPSAGELVSLRDQFSEVLGDMVDHPVNGLHRFCAPVIQNGTEPPASARFDHQACYLIQRPGFALLLAGTLDRFQGPITTEAIVPNMFCEPADKLTVDPPVERLE